MNEASVGGGRSRFVHASVTVSSDARAEGLFGALFGMTLIKKSEVGPDLCHALFGVADGARIRVYEAGPATVEVFVAPGMARGPGGLDHICLELADLAGALEQAAGLGLEVRRFRKDDKEVVILVDGDGNLYELKQAAGV